MYISKRGKKISYTAYKNINKEWKQFIQEFINL